MLRVRVFCHLRSVLLWFFFFGIVETTAGGVPRCSLRTVNGLCVEMVCSTGEEELYRNQTCFSEETETINILPGVQLFADVLGDGKRALVSVKDTNLELHDIHLPGKLKMKKLNVVVPLAAKRAEVTIRDSTFSECWNSSLVGGIYLNNAVASISDCQFSSCGSAGAPVDTGAIRLDSYSSATIADSMFYSLESNFAAVVANKGSNVIFKDSFFKMTNGVEAAAVLVMSGGKAEFRRTKIHSCTSKKKAAISLIKAEQLTIESCVLKLNRGLDGGSVYFSDSSREADKTDHRDVQDVVIKDSYFDNNVAMENGGALYIHQADVFIEGTGFGQNRARDRGAGLFITDAPELSILSSSFEAHSFSGKLSYSEHSGAGIYASNINKVKVRDSKIVDNKADVSGGGAFFSNVRQLEVSETVIRKNSAREKAGFAVQAVKVLIMEGVNITHNVAENSAAGLSVAENSQLLLKRVIFSHNDAARESAASIYSSRSVKTEDCIFQFNAAMLQYAGGLYIDAALDVTILKTQFIRNKAPSEGAAVQVKSIDFLTINESEFVKNTASSGAACDIKKSSDVYIQASTFKMNEASEGSGGSISLEMVDRAFIDDSEFHENQAKDDGGAVFVNSLYRMKINRSLFSGNRAELGSGGSLNVREVDNAIFNATTFRNNSAYFNGGAVFLGSVYNALDLIDSKFDSNDAVGRVESNGGALAVNIFSKLAVQRCRFSRNRAQNNGGAMCFPKTKRELTRSAEMAHSRFTSNSADRGSGGAIFFEISPLFVLHKCHFSLNKAFKEGGAVLIQTGTTVKIDGSHFGENKVLDEEEASSDTSGSSSWTYKKFGRVVLVQNGSETSYSTAKVTNDEQSNAVSTQLSGETNGGALAVKEIEHVEINFSTIEGNSASGRGGGVFAQAILQLTSYETHLIDNQASISAGALYMTNITEARLTKSGFEGNGVGRDLDLEEVSQALEGANGGAFVVTYSSNIRLQQVQFVSNQAARYGGAGSCTMVRDMSFEDCKFDRNRALAGGALKISRSSWGTINKCSFVRNVGTGKPSLNDYQALVLGEDTEPEEHSSSYSGHGGAILMDHSSDFNLTSPRFEANEATGSGGAIHSNGTINVAFFKSSFLNNSALLGGGAISLNFGNMSLSVDHFEHNWALNGGILAVFNSTLTGFDIQTEKNIADKYGGLVYCVKPSNISIRSSKFTDDGSNAGSSFKADCDCQLTVLESKVVCSNNAAKNCGTFDSDKRCVGNVILENAHVIRYEKSWTVVVVVVVALVILPILVLLARVCIRCSTKAAYEAGLYKGQQASFALREWGPVYNDPELGYTVICRDAEEAQRVMGALSPNIPPSHASAWPAAALQRGLEVPVDSSKSLSNPQLQQSELLTPFLRAPLQQQGAHHPTTFTKKRHSFLRPRSVTPYPLSDLQLDLSDQKTVNSYCILSDRLSEEFDSSPTHPSPCKRTDEEVACQDLYNCMHEQQDIRYEYEEMLLTRSESS